MVTALRPATGPIRSRLGELVSVATFHTDSAGVETVAGTWTADDGFTTYGVVRVTDTNLAADCDGGHNAQGLRK